MKRYTYYRKLSVFMKWVIGIVAATIIAIILYLVLDATGFIRDYKECFTNYRDYFANIPDDTEHIIYKTFNKAKSVAFVFIAITAIIYIVISLWNLLTHRAVEDSRMHCLPMISSVIFLIIENAFLHLFYLGGNSAFYEITMGVFSAAVVGVITFASLKFSFEISNKQKRLMETAGAKPNLDIKRDGSGGFKVNVTRNDCYLCGIYIGKISKTEYIDIKRTGNKFIMDELYFPNQKFLYKKDTCSTAVYQPLNLSSFVKNVDYINNVVKSGKKEVYLIFRDMQNFYYFAQLPEEDDDYNVIGVDGYDVTRLLYKYNKIEYKKEKNGGGYIGDDKYIIYETMDWFKIPYNFHVK